MIIDKHLQKNVEGKILGFGTHLLTLDHLTFWVGNAKQAAAYYTSRFGFEYYMYKGLENGERDIASHAIKSSDGIIFIFCSPYNNYASQAMNENLVNHGDAVRDIAYSVDNATKVYEIAVNNGAIPLRYPTKHEDKDGSVVVSTVRAFGDVTHTFVERKKYKGPFNNTTGLDISTLR